MFLILPTLSSVKRFCYPLFLILFCSISLGAYSSSSEHSKKGAPAKKITSKKESAFQPLIGLTKEIIFSRCDSVQYHYTVMNLSTNNEALENIEINDEFYGSIHLQAGEPSKPDNDDILSAGEEWVYDITFAITPNQRFAGTLGSGAQVTSNPVGQEFVTVLDDSHPTDFNSDGETSLDLDACRPRIGLVKRGEVPDPNSSPPCVITYTFEITNESPGPDRLEIITLNDKTPLNIQDLDVTNNNVPNLEGDVLGDTPQDDYLQVGETWSFTVSYDPESSDRIAGQVTSLSEDVDVVAGIEFVTLFNASVSDNADDNNPLEDDDTVTDISACSPRIAVTKTGSLLPGGGGTDACTTIRYTYLVTNQSPGLEALDNVVLRDFGIAVSGPAAGDPGDVGTLEDGEIWEYTEDYTITQNDLNNGFVSNQAEVTALISAGGPNDAVSDFSHVSNPDADGLTTVDISSCQIIDLGLTLVATGFPDTDADGCPDMVTYTYQARNNGNVDLDFVDISDTLSNSITEANPNGDDNGDGFINPNETWLFTANYDIIETDIANSPLLNQATINTVIVGAGTPVSDLSHESQFDQDDFTLTDVTGTCFSTAALGITKRADANNLIDDDMDGCLDAIEYTIQISNTGAIPLTNIRFDDPQFGNDITGPFSENGNNDGILEVNEVWTYIGTDIYDLTQNDIENIGSVSTQAQVFADAAVGISISDLSHPSDVNADAATIVDVTGTCWDTVTIILTKTAIDTTIDSDMNGCVDQIQYGIVLENQGGMNLDVILFEDDQLNDILTEAYTESQTSDGILEIGENWTFIEVYNITDIDATNGFVNGEARATVQPEGTSANIMASDAISANIPGACADGPSLGVLRRVSQPLTDTDADGCPDLVEFEIEVRNTGGLDLANVTLIDPQLDNVSGPFDDDGDGELDQNESWRYTGTRNITQSDIDGGDLIGGARVTANPVGNNAIEVSDLSHPNDLSANQDNIIDVSGACDDTVGISVLRTAVLTDTDNDNCDDAIEITIIIENQGVAPLEAIEFDDTQLGSNITGPFTNDNGNNTLETGEDWTYAFTYDLSQNEIDNSPLFGSATVRANHIGSTFQVTDDSHPDLRTADQQNSTNTADACAESPAITLTRTAQLSDMDMDNCPETIDVSITVTNTGGVGLDTIDLTDDLVNPILNGNGNGDNILDVNESWTYVGSYAIELTDIINSTMISGASVSANVLGGTFQVSASEQNNNDLSAACSGEVGISLVREAQPMDTEPDGCVDRIDFTLIVTNTGDADLVNLEINDPQLQILTIPDEEDGVENRILESGEVWTFYGSYNITETDISGATIISRATVTANHINSSFQVSDESHPSLLNDNGDNTIDVSDACDTLISPAFGLIKQFSSFGDGNNDGCPDTITYTYRLENLGNEAITNITISDVMLGGNNLAIVSGDEGNLNILEVGETWIFENLNYAITPEDLNLGEVTTQASVSGLSVDSATQVSDVSDNNSTLENDLTVTSVNGLCPSDTSNIGLIKTASLFDSDGDQCDDSILYFFTVENLGSIPLQNVLLEDLFLGITLTQPNSRSLNEDDILDVNERWSYNMAYPISEADIDRTFVENQAMVTAYRTDQTDTFVTDLSHENLYTSDAPTNISVIEACVNTSAGIGLIKRGNLTDSNNDSCPDSILYTFTVGNLGNQPLTGIILRDALLDDVIAGPVSGDSNDNNILESDEEWIYTATYSLTPQDLSLEQVENLATVSATVAGQENTIVNDISDNDVFTEDDPTVISVSDACEGTTPVDSNFRIFTGITPNGDGINDFFRIQGIENYPSNKLEVFNRWGIMVYEAEGYGNGNELFAGVSSGRVTIAGDRELPSGTYFYILSFSEQNPGQDNYTGYLYINRD